MIKLIVFDWHNLKVLETGISVMADFHNMAVRECQVLEDGYDLEHDDTGVSYVLLDTPEEAMLFKLKYL